MQPTHEYYVYIISNFHGTIYTGVTSNLIARLEQHSQHVGSKFTAKYQVHRLLFYEKTDNVIAAIQREKEIKSWSRKKKLDLIRTMNPKFKDLANELF